MTAQSGEKLLYKGRQVIIQTCPLAYYFDTLENKPEFQWNSTDCYRGYFGKWEIKDDKLFLIDLEAYIKDYEEVGIEYIFPGQKEVFAEWFSETIRIPQGEALMSVRNFPTVLKETLLLEFKNGVLINSSIKDNTEYVNSIRGKFSNATFYSEKDGMMIAEHSDGTTEVIGKINRN